MDASTTSTPPAPHHVVLLFTDLAGSVALKLRCGTAVYAELISRHDAIFHAIVGAIPAAEIVKDTGDGFLSRFATARDAVIAGLRFQFAIHAEAWQPEPLPVRAAVHLGDMMELDRDVDGRPKLVGLAADLAARLMGLALPGQILMTRAAFDDARQFLRAHPPVGTGVAEPPRLEWIAHGAYRLEGLEESVEVFEVGAVGLAPLAAPPGSGKAQRVVSLEQERMLGWRPAVGLEVPHRQNSVLVRKLGEGGFGEVWLVQHRQTRAQRVFKFCFDADRVRSLKRELTLFRLLRESLGERDDIARLYDVQLAKPPYFLESEFTAPGSLSDWAQRQDGVTAIPLTQRLDLLAATAEALAAAHSVGILHKDIKPSNILISLAADGTPRPHLADFGIGALTDRARFQRGNITLGGFTESLVIDKQSSLTGTHLYLPPEILAGRPFTIQGDVYALGVLLYQLVVGDLTRPLATGWQRDVPDALLSEDIAACVDGDPARRLASAAELAARLRNLAPRRAARRQADHNQRLAQRRERVGRWTMAAACALVLLLTLAGLAYYRERNLRIATARAREEAEAARHAEREQRRLAEEHRAEAEVQRVEALRQAAIAQAVNEFLNEDLLAAVDPAEQGREVTMRAVLDRAAEAVEGRFDDAPLVEAGIRLTLARTYLSLGEYDHAEPHVLAARRLCQTTLGPDRPETLTCMNVLGRVYESQGRYAEAETVYRESLAGRRAALGDEDSDTLVSMNNLASLYQRLGRYDDAERLHVQELAICRRVRGEEHPSTLTSMNNLACLYRQLGRYDEAEALHVRALESDRRVRGEEHPSTLAAMNNLGLLYLNRNRLDEAEPLFRKTLEIRQRVLGAEHPDTLGSMHNLASLYHAQGRCDDAVLLFAQTLRTRRQVLGENHPSTLVSQWGLVQALIARRTFQEAEVLAKDCYERNQQVFGPTHSETRDAAELLIALYDAWGQREQAAEWRGRLRTAEAVEAARQPASQPQP